MQGYCVTCPAGQVYLNNECVCSQGSVKINGKCQTLCKSGQLTDGSNFCYICPLNEIILNNKC